MKVLGERLIVEPIEPEETTAGGIILAETARKESITATVIHVDPAVGIDIGSVVLYDKYSGSKIEIPATGKEYLVLNKHDVIAIL